MHSITLLVMLAILVAADLAKAQSSAGTSASVTATVIVPITIAKNADMTLGKIVSDPAGGTLAIAANGVRTFSNSNNHTASNPAGIAAAFHVTGDASCTFSTLHTGSSGAGAGANGTWLSDGSGGNMWFNFDANATGQTISSSTGADFKVTGTLTIGASQPAGTYSGSFTELVAYE